MDDVPLCPPWWPEVLWRLHFPPPHIIDGGGGSPVNRPPDVNRILLALQTYSSSYHVSDVEVATKLRAAAKAEVVAAAHALTERE